MRVSVCDQASFKFNQFGPPSQAIYDFAERQYQNTAGLLNNVSRGFMESARETFNDFMDSAAVRRTRAALRTIQHATDADIIRTLQTIGDFQQAGSVMQRWVMAEPVTRARWQSGACEGYAESYVDIEPGALGKDHYDWRRVNDGIIDDSGSDWEATTYFDELLDENDDLDIVQKAYILRTWDILKQGMKGKDDYTSPLNASL